MKRTSWSAGLSVTADGVGVVSHAGAIAPRLLADQVGLTAELSGGAADSDTTAAGQTPADTNGDQQH